MRRPTAIASTPLNVIAACLVATALTACATVTRAPDPSKVAPDADQGVVVVSVTGNTARLTQFDQLTLRKLPAPGATGPTEKYVLGQVSAGLARDTALFAGALPPGEFVLEAMVDFGSERTLNLGEGGQAMLGAFRVKAGALVDLGRLIVTPLNTRVLVGRSARVTSNRELVRRFAREQEQFYAREVAPGWGGPRTPSDRVEEYALTTPAGADAATELPTGEVVAASRLGTVLVRDTQGRWRGVRGEGLESLLWVKPVDAPESVLVAVGELNTLLRLDRASGTLVRLDTGNLPPGNLLFIEGSARAGWYVAHQRGDDVTLYRSSDLERGDWKPLRSESVARSLWSGASNMWIWRTDGGFGYALSDGSIWLCDAATAAWTQRRAPKDSRIVDLAPGARGAIGILTSPGGGFGGVFASLYVSRDGAATWHEVSSPFAVKVRAPYLTPKGTLLLGNGGFGGGDPELHASGDGGKTWAKLAASVALTEKVVVLPTRGLLAVDAGGSFGLSSIRHSSDEGTTWQLEYSSFDEAAYRAEQKRKVN